MNLLLISNSTMAGQAYLEYPKMYIKDFLGNNVKKVLFLPFAGVSFSYDDYAKKVQERFTEIGYEVDSIHRHDDMVKAVEEAEAIVVGGGNTFHLIKEIQDNNLINPIKEKVLSGTPYIGWSAGSNVACPTIRTTNDMPIIEPASFNATGLIKFQINPHYLDANPDGHAGETREQRLEEFMEVNQDIYIVGLREGTMLEFGDNKLELKGNLPARIFKYKEAPYEIQPGGDLSFLL
jgi:dipeptidase E